MNLETSLLGSFLLVALLAAACGPVTTTPEAVTNESQSSNSQQTTEVMMDGDDATSVMKEDSEAMMAEDSDASMEVDDSKSTKEEDSESAMDMDDTDSMMEESSEGSRDKDDSESTMEKEDASAMIDLPAWFDAELTDVNTEEVLAVADLQDKVVLVETMAIWCSSCLRQQKEVKALHELLGMRDDLVTLVLDIDPNEDADNLRTFAEKHGFSWFYAVVPREVAREIGQLYGDQFLNPPSTSMLIIDQHGEVHLLPFGRKTVQDLQEVLEPFLAAGM